VYVAYSWKCVGIQLSSGKLRATPRTLSKKIFRFLFSALLHILLNNTTNALSN